MTENEKKLLDALKALVEWYETPEVMVSVGVQRFSQAKALIKVVEDGQN